MIAAFQQWPDRWAVPPATPIAAFSALFCVVATATVVMVAVHRKARGSTPGTKSGAALALLSLTWGFTAWAAAQIDGYGRPAPLLATLFAVLCAGGGAWILRNRRRPE